MQEELEIFPGLEELSRRAAEEFCRRAESAALARGQFTVALSGGSTPRRLFALLASAKEPYRRRVPWAKTFVFWSDERQVPPGDERSNYRMAREALLAKLRLPRANVHRVLGEHPSALKAAQDYELELRSFFRLEEGQRPRFDLILLGLGPEGHTASLFPGSEALSETRRLVVAPKASQHGTARVTFTPAAINAAACVVFLVSGADKAPALKAALESDLEPMKLPARAVRPSEGKLLWLADEAAAGLLDRARLSRLAG
jgi:6-phosphogluconolactonase